MTPVFYLRRRLARGYGANFPGRADAALGRFGFVGHDAPSAIQQSYVNKGVPGEYRKPGAANPIKYTSR